MRTAAQVFYLAAFSILGNCHSAQGTSGTCAIDPKAIVSDACTSYAALETLNAELAPTLKDITQNTDFFSYYRLNLYNKVCPFWTDEHSLCGNRACAVDTLENVEDIPLIWRAEELSKLEGATAGHPTREKQKQRPQKPLQGKLGEDVGESCVVEYDDECDERDYCVPDDEGATGKGDYVSLVNNTERFTGYAGAGASQVWDAIYKENCFSRPGTQSSAANVFFPVPAKEAADDLRHVFQEYGRQHVDDQEVYPLDDECLEQRAFYRVVSGMHASISAHLCWEYFNQSTGEWFPNVDCYKERLHNYPGRVSNVYFNYAILTRAMVKLRTYIQSYTFCSGDPIQDQDTKTKVMGLIDQAAAAPSTFDESLLFHDGEGLALKEDFKNRFRNVSRIMDCVGCDKCRLWGKLQTAGYGAALKILFEFDENKNGENPLLRRTELVALVNTFGRVSHSLAAIKEFRAQVTGAQASSSEEASFNDVGDGVEDDVEDFDYESTSQSPFTVKDEFAAEFDLVWRAFKFVIKSWISLPFKIPAIVIMELNRLWAFWLGLPVPPRSWGIHFPARDEL